MPPNRRGIAGLFSAHGVRVVPRERGLSAWEACLHVRTAPWAAMGAACAAAAAGWRCCSAVSSRHVSSLVRDWSHQVAARFRLLSGCGSGWQRADEDGWSMRCCSFHSVVVVGVARRGVNWRGNSMGERGCYWGGGRRRCQRARWWALAEAGSGLGVKADIVVGGRDGGVEGGLGSGSAAWTLSGQRHMSPVRMGVCR